jgi:hypothetical protein
MAQERRMITIIGEVFDKLGHSWNGHRVNVAELRSKQEDLIPLTADHTEIIGRVLTLTRVKGGAVWAVAVGADRCDPLLEVDEPIYFSPGTSTRADGTDGIILELALVSRTARVGAQPVLVKPGDVRKPSDRGRWSLRGLAYELVPRAAEEIRCRPKGGPFHIRDLEHEKWMERENERRTYVPLPLARSNPGPGQLVAPQERAGWKPGDLEWSRHPGKILSVR